MAGDEKMNVEVAYARPDQQLILALELPHGASVAEALAAASGPLQERFPELDLAEAEGLADLVDAETEGQRRQALRQRRGALSAVYEGWRGKLIEAAALIEAEIDFPDEDLPGALAQRAGPFPEWHATCS